MICKWSVNIDEWSELIDHKEFNFFYLDISNNRNIASYLAHPVRFYISGVPQGTVLAPLLFLLYINDLPNHIQSTLRLYADNVLIYSTIHSIQDSYRLQQDLLTLQKWAEARRMEFNPSKCEHLMLLTNTIPFCSITNYVITSSNNS